jgi:cyclohexanone monooxygenase
MTEGGIVANGQEYGIDCLIFATGFEVGTSFTRRAGYDVIGRGGKTLSEHWENGMRTLHGMTVHGFPNCFFVGRSQSATTVNLPLSLENQTRHVTYIVSEARERGVKTFELTAEAESAYVQEVRRLSGIGERFYRECTPGYYNSEGAAGNKNGFFSESYGAGSLIFFDMLDKWRNDGRMDGLSLR